MPTDEFRKHYDVVAPHESINCAHIFGGCPNTTYGESVGCVAITGNASIVTIIASALGCILFSFITPLIAFIDSIPRCVMGGVCVALYGFITVYDRLKYKRSVICQCLRT